MIINVENEAAQGDIYIRRVGALPPTATPRDPTDGKHVLAHSETGHHHYTDVAGVALYGDPGNALVCYLSVEGPHADVIHARPWDTHRTLRLPRGVWEIRRQREFTPAGWARVED